VFTGMGLGGLELQGWDSLGGREEGFDLIWGIVFFPFWVVLVMYCPCLCVCVCGMTALGPLVGVGRAGVLAVKVFVGWIYFLRVFFFVYFFLFLTLPFFPFVVVVFIVVLVMGASRCRV
jgi:hypothetical protein